ncbi:MAG: YceD family protein [Solirubrobacterales bacterium]
MSQRADILDLARFARSPGEGRRVDVAVSPGELNYGDQAYAVEGGGADARVDVSRTSRGYALRLRFAAPVSGPCVRCLGDAATPVEVDAREVDQPGGSEEEGLRSPYVDGDELDVSAWAHDALALAMPGQFLCRPECRGLCPVCGASLNDADPAKHRHEADADPGPMAKLREIRFD